MREDQHIGLIRWAQKFIERGSIPVTVEIVHTLPDGTRKVMDSFPSMTNPCQFPSGKTYSGAWDGDHVLHEYRLDGKVYEEFVQTEPWSSGPCFFLALRDPETGNAVRGSLWAEEEINEYL